jgi:hypothetical protein
MEFTARSFICFDDLMNKFIDRMIGGVPRTVLFVFLRPSLLQNAIHIFSTLNSLQFSISHRQGNFWSSYAFQHCISSIAPSGAGMCEVDSLFHLDVPFRSTGAFASIVLFAFGFSLCCRAV